MQKEEVARCSRTETHRDTEAPRGPRERGAEFLASPQGGSEVHEPSSSVVAKSHVEKLGMMAKVLTSHRQPA